MSEGPPLRRYCPFYCEENIWHLCADERFEGRAAHVLVISNRDRRVAMWGQRISRDPALPTVWDYHVVLVVDDRTGFKEVWDLDAAVPPPRPALTWLDASFRGAGVIPPQFEPHFRLVLAEDYRLQFRSDRGHMRRPDGTYLRPPPGWPPILDGASDLARFLDMDDASFGGQLFDLAGLRRWLGGG